MLNPDQSETPISVPRVDQRCAAGWLRLADTHHNAGRMEEALACYQNAIRLHPRLFEASYNSGLIYQSRRQAAQAATFYRKALQVNPDLAPAHNNLGRLHVDAGGLKPAADCFLHAIRLKPDFAEPHFNLGDSSACPQAAPRSDRGLHERPAS